MFCITEKTYDFQQISFLITILNTSRKAHTRMVDSLMAVSYIQARVQELGGGGYISTMSRSCVCGMPTQSAELGGSWGMLLWENFENRVVFLYSGAF